MGIPGSQNGGTLVPYFWPYELGVYHGISPYICLYRTYSSYKWLIVHNLLYCLFIYFHFYHVGWLQMICHLKCVYIHQF